MNESSVSLHRMSSTLNLRFACPIAVFFVFLFTFGPSPSKVVASPGSALDQYVEEVPNAGGSEPTSELKPGDPAKSLGKEALQQFQKFGEDGYDAALAASADDPRRQRVGKNSNGADGSETSLRARGVDSADSGIGEVIGAATSATGYGSGPLPFLVSIAVILIMAMVVVRRNHST